MGDRVGVDGLDDAAVTIYANGTVFTGNRRRPWAEACAVLGSTVLGVGPTSDLRRDHPGAIEHDLDGGTLLPGLIDAHNHFLSTGESLASLDLRYPGLDSAASLLQVIRDAAEHTPTGDPITGFGFDDAKYELPTLAELDAAAGNHPLHLFHTSGHNVLVNSLVLAEAGVDEAAADPPGGRFVRDGDGRLSGLCLDAACGLVLPTAVDIGSHGPNFHTKAPMEALVAAVDRASRAYLAAGLTCVADAQVTARELAAYREARTRGVLGVRTVCMPLSHQLDAYRSIGLVGPFGDGELSIGHMKIYADGSLTGGTAAFSRRAARPRARRLVLPRTRRSRRADRAGVVVGLARRRPRARGPRDRLRVGRFRAGASAEITRRPAAPDRTLRVSRPGRHRTDASSRSHRGEPAVVPPRLRGRVRRVVG